MSTLGAMILCGGRSSRMGRDKATLPFGDETLLERVLHRLWPVCVPRMVVGRRSQTLPTLPDDVQVVFDEIEDQGPLGGLAPGLRAAEDGVSAWFVTSCDVPFVSPSLVSFLAERLADDVDVVVPRVDGFLQPLTAVYRPTVLPELEALFAAGGRRPVHLFDRVRTRIVEEDELAHVDPELLSFLNCNRPEDYRAALVRAGLDEGRSA